MIIGKDGDSQRSGRRRRTGKAKGWGSPRGAQASGTPRAMFPTGSSAARRARSSKSLCLPFPPPMMGLSPVRPARQGHPVNTPPPPVSLSQVSTQIFNACSKTAPLPTASPARTTEKGTRDMALGLCAAGSPASIPSYSNNPRCLLRVHTASIPNALDPKGNPSLSQHRRALSPCALSRHHK